jgi:hypothetical protein
MPDYNVTVAMGGSLYPTSLTYTAKDSNYTLTTGESGGVFSNDSAAGAVTFTLPTPVVGLNYRIVETAGQSLLIDPDAGSTITLRAITGAAGGSIEPGSNGAAAHILAISTTEWLVIMENGLWVFT